MRVLSVREFSDDVFEILARVEDGESFWIERDGDIIAELVPKDSVPEAGV